jgi:hypothetical protein
MEDERGRACSKHGDMRNVYTILAGKSEGEKLTCRWMVRGHFVTCALECTLGAKYL